ncbi:MAG: Helix-turn-helix domain [Thermoplasmata archaeon]|jgi:predicted transcriptional regulator|nr:Helix-turn-helix domain [Thermoplasmata archaeon]
MASRWLSPHPRRDLILAIIEEQPGLCFRALARATGFKQGTLHYHVSVLLRGGAIWTTRHSTRLLHFPGATPRTPIEVREALAAHALDELDQGLLAWLREAGPTSQKAALASHVAAGVPRSSVQRRLNRLAEQGFILRREGVQSVVYATPTHGSGPLEEPRGVPISFAQARPPKLDDLFKLMACIPGVEHG